MTKKSLLLALKERMKEYDKACERAEQVFVTKHEELKALKKEHDKTDKELDAD